MMNVYMNLFVCPGKESNGADCRRPIFSVVLAESPPPEHWFRREDVTPHCYVCGWVGPIAGLKSVASHSWPWPY